MPVATATTSLTSSIFGAVGSKENASISLSSGASSGGGGGAGTAAAALSGLFDPSRSFPPRTDRVRRPAVGSGKKTKEAKKTEEAADDDDNNAAGDADAAAAVERPGKKKSKKKSDDDDGSPPAASAPEDGGAEEKKKKGRRRRRRKRGSESAGDGDGNVGESGEAKVRGDVDGEGKSKGDAEAEAEEEDEATVSAEERTVFVGNLPADSTRKSLTALFRPCGRVVSARLRSVAVTGVKLPPGKAGNQNLMRKVCANTGLLDEEAPKRTAQGYVVFASSKSVPKALAMNNAPASPDHRLLKLRVDTADPTLDHSRSVFVGNLPYKADETTLRDHFSAVDVTGVRIVRDPSTQQCKGFGYVLLKERSDVPAALEMHGTKYMRKELRVSVCGKRTKGKRGERGGKRPAPGA
eukprot:CAMPEP_0113575852 /NCGR_PEP_ID=MMETSP0015_2-20120614/27938_1 /TAXON_ID=2838 /ORGANISM="Odontella" /LENGTH=408 /DNA_ID=CAMNT_0000479157 /DNA_START=176 /DNA_END=1398 /DNA_ORIENTATION=+ /assembly_acc=CAM_ASM_000160